MRLRLWLGIAMVALNTAWFATGESGWDVLIPLPCVVLGAWGIADAIYDMTRSRR